MEFLAHDFERLERLRDAFLAGRGRSPWRDRRDLAVYDATFGQRIAWKWRAVLDELVLRGFKPPSGVIVDWGAGTGIASRTWLARFAAPAGEVHVHDASPLAVAYARDLLAAEHAGVRVADGTPPPRAGVLLVSHVIDELEPAELEDLVAYARNAACVVWVEPGNPGASRALGAVRETLRESCDVLAPCTHSANCPALAAAHASDWCHFFAKPPAEVFTRGDWAQFGERLGIDLRSLPYSFLALRARASGAAVTEPAPPGLERVLGRPRIEKGHVRAQVCGADDLRTLRVLEREHKELVKRLEKPAGECAIYRFEAENGRVRNATRWP